MLRLARTTEHIQIAVLSAQRLEEFLNISAFPSHQDWDNWKKKKKEENQNSISNPNTIVLDKRFGPVYVEQCMTSWQLQPSVWCERAHSNMHRTVCKTHRRDHKICSFSVVDVSLTPAWSGAIGSYKGLHSRLAACANCSHFSCLWT